MDNEHALAEVHRPENLTIQGNPKNYDVMVARLLKKGFVNENLRLPDKSSICIKIFIFAFS